MRKIKRALISVSDKAGLIPFARELRRQGVEILSTGGTLAALHAAGIPATSVEEVTGFPEILEGRVKTLHPKIHGGLLYRRDKKSHQKEARKHGIAPIDMVVANLYPFEQMVGAPLHVALENIDIGGPSILRSAAKNFKAVAAVCDPNDYPTIMTEMTKNKGGISGALRVRLATKVFERISLYDRSIAAYLKQHTTNGSVAESLPEKLDILCEKTQELRYGENPHQRAAFYVPPGVGAGSPSPQAAKTTPLQQLHGKELSFNNLLDIEATIDVMREFAEPAACVVKHTNPCGIAEGKDTREALSRAIECDAMSAFGGIVGIDRPCDKKTAQEVLDRLKFFEVFVAPSFEPSALSLLKSRPHLRLIATGPVGEGTPFDLRFLQCGILLQDRDRPIRSHLSELKKNLHFVTQAKLEKSELEDLIFAWKCVKLVKSNAIVITQGRQTVGIGAGQMSRVDSVAIACQKAGWRAEGGILASDAFFPMPDAIEAASEHKIRAVLQPGGSLRDADIIAACDRFGMAMAFTGERHFKH